MDFQNRNRNYLNRKMNYLSHFRASDQKTFFTRCFTFSPSSLRLIFKTENGIIQTGNGIISPTSKLLIKTRYFTKCVSHLIQGAKNKFSK